jgi:hypothetical protein
MSDATQSKAERNARIYARRIEGRSFAVIGREFGLSPETIRLTVRLMERKARWREICGACVQVDSRFVCITVLPPLFGTQL